MQRFINDPDRVVEDMLEGFVKAYDTIEYSPTNKKVVVYNEKTYGKVGLVSGGGSGHEPAFLGYVGKHMLDAVAIGEVFSSPAATTFHDAFIQADQGAGVACLFGNYAGDNMNVKMAIDMAEDDGIEVKYVVATDDISSSPQETKEKRHGIAGGMLMWKTAGAKAAEGADLDEVIRVAQKTVDHTRSICVGLSACTIPAVGHANFTIAENTYEFGIGHHGEPGLDVRKMQRAEVIAHEMMCRLDEDMPLVAGMEVAIIVSGLGSTPLMEQYIMYHEAATYLEEKGVHIYHPYIGNFVTSLDMNGIAITILVVDDELKELLAYDAQCPGLTQQENNK